MDIELARTFLEIVNTGSFIKAAERMHVTQTAVTARIRSLESHLSCQLFVRNRSGARLTEEGEQFVEYATSLVDTWTLAKNRIRLPKGRLDRIKLGTETSLWNPLMLNWVIWIKQHMPDIAVETEIAPASHLIASLERGTLDAIVLHRPNYYSGFVVEQILEEKLVHVQKTGASEPDYFIDWGEEFRRQYKAALPNSSRSPFSFNLGQHALHMMLQEGGNGFFRTRVVAPYIESGVLERVSDSPEFTYPIYISFRKKNVSKTLDRAILGLKSNLSADHLTIV